MPPIRSKLLKLHVELTPTSPRVWRMFIVEDSISMYELHEILQVVMGWMHSHLFIFEKGKISITEPSDDGEWSGPHYKNARKVKVSEIFKKTGDKIPYIYDMGDSWVHTVVLKKVLKKSDISFSPPRCIDGGNACPPEDCGGFWGFEELKQILADPKHPEHSERTHWLDEYYPNYDPSEFSLSAINKILHIGAGRYLELAPLLYQS